MTRKNAIKASNPGPNWNNWWKDYYPNRNPGGVIGSPDGGGGGMDPGQENAFALMRDLLGQYGLDSLAGVLRDLILDGVTDQATLTLRLQDTNEWKTRFAGNEQLRQNGLPVLSIAEYLAVERSYAQVLKNYGLPEGFYDDPSDFAGWIGNSVSANELNQRAQMYSDLARRDDDGIKQQLREMGFGDGDLIAFMMDPNRAAPLLQQKYNAALVGGAAKRAGLSSANAESLANLGITEQQAIQGYSIISEGLDDAERLGDIYGMDYGQDDFENEVFKGDGQAASKRKKLASRERATFSGSSGIGQGSQQRSTSGSY